MSDVIPNYELERKQLELEVHQLEHNLMSQDLRLLQLDDEKARIIENQEATRKAITDLKAQALQLKQSKQETA